MEDSSAARLVRASREMPTPGMMPPPRMQPSLSMTMMVVAVPISMTMQGQEYSSRAATYPAIRSGPVVSGWRMVIFRSSRVS